MKTEGVIDILGFGVFQKRLIAFGSITSVLLGVSTAAFVFSTYLPKYRCAIPGLENDTFIPIDARHKYLINLTIPEGETGLCMVYGWNSSIYLLDSFQHKNVDNVELFLPAFRPELRQCDKWVYDTSLFERTLATEYNFVCDSALKIAHCRMMNFAGLLVGAILSGIIGDLFGRKSSFTLGLVLKLTAGIIIPWISNVETYMAMLFFNGFAGVACYMNIFVIVMEFIEKRKRILSVTIVTLGWVTGLVYSTGFAYFTREWRTLHMAALYPFVLMFCFIWCVPESIRWLITHRKYKKAQEILRKGARVNHITLQTIQFDEEEPTKAENNFLIMVEIVKSPVLMKRFLIAALNWATVAMVYYGLTLNAGNLSGNLFVEFLSSTLVEVPAYLLVLFAIDRVGRKSLHCTLMVVGGLSCIATIFPVVFDRTDLLVLTITLATIGKATVTAAYQTIYIYTPELFPTTLRMSVMGASSAFSRSGAIAAPYIAELGKMIGGTFSTIIPLLIFGGFTLFAGLLCIVLPETKGIELPNSLEEAKQLTRHKTKSAHLDDTDGIPLGAMPARVDSNSEMQLERTGLADQNTKDNQTSH